MCPAMQGRPQLITYVDRLAGDLRGLRSLLDGRFSEVFGGVHLLPFFDPIDGADAGFDPVEHDVVDPRLGDWADVAALGADVEVMADLIVNHVSAHSEAFRDWQQHGDASAHAGLFLTLDAVFPDGATEEDLTRIYRPRPGLPLTPYDIDGRPRLVWTTFTGEQIDIDVEDERGWAHLVEILDRFQAAGIGFVRLDAVGYAIKRAGTSCFMIPETFDFIERLAGEATNRGMRLLVEIHSHFQTQIDIAARVDLVYDFALPPLVLHALHFADGEPLRRWIDRRPVNCVTVLDTHDGIGVIDVAPEGDRPGLLNADEVDALVERIHDASGGESRQATGAAASNLDLYQVNCTFPAALGNDDDAVLVARLIQLVLPGIPQVYYAGLLAHPNDMELLAVTGVGRDINRPYVVDRLDELLARPIVGRLLDLVRWRTENSELFEGRFEIRASERHELRLSWTTDEARLAVDIDLRERTAEVAVHSGESVHALRF